MKRLALKPPLITPSASPPASHTFFPQPYRIPDQASPAKRPRLSSAPRQFQPHASTSSSTTSLDQIDFQKAREASALRMLDVWSNLADRYSRPLDEDDIIDLNTGEVVKDRGVIRGSRHWGIGCFADDVGDEEAEEGDEEEDDDDIDELDSFAPHQSTDEQPLIEAVGARNVPPVRAMDPADAEDLREFLEAERRRREACGSDVDETGSSAAESPDEGGNDSRRPQDSTYAESTNGFVRERSATSGVLASSKSATPSLEIDRTPVQRSATVFVDSGSDDELVSYELDEASIVYRIPKEEAQDSDSDVEFVEPPLPPSRPKPRPKGQRELEPKSSQPSGSARRTPTQQLQTPPLSSATPSDDYYIELPRDSSSPLPPSSPPSSQYSPTKGPSHVQNKRSPGSRRPASLLEPEVLLTPIPRLDLTKISKGKPYKSKNKPPRPQPAKSGSGSSTIANSNGLLNKEPSARPKMEVVITKRTPLQHHPQSLSSPTQHAELTATKKNLRRMCSLEDTRPTGKGKEKEKQPVYDTRSHDQNASEDMDQNRGDSPSPASSRKVGSPSSRAKEAEAENPRSHKQKPSPTTTNKKRKRVVSSEVEIVELGTMELPQDGQPQREVAIRAPTPRHTRRDTPSSISNKSLVSADVKDPEPSKPKRNPSSGQRSRSSSRPRHSGYDSDSSSRSSLERFPDHGHHFNRAHSHFGSMPPSDPIYYPYPQPPYPPQMYGPIPDPRAQYIITQAMHQLSALVGGPWTPPGSHHRGSTPFTPSHSRHQSRASGSMYSTPTHHPHPYPYSYDTYLSRGALPPDSPEVQSSPAVAGSSGRRKSLVKRSRSRGRRVSFRIEEGIVDTIDIPSSYKGHDDEDNGLERLSDEDISERETARRKKKDKDKAKPTEKDLGRDPQPDRGRAFTRAQTPGPPVRDPSSDPPSAKPSAKPPKVRGTSRSRPSQAR